MLPRPRRALKLFLFVLLPLLFAYLLASRQAFEQKMPSLQPPEKIATALLAQKGLSLESLKIIQSLWAGYGQICQVIATSDGPGDVQGKQPYILKLITPPPTRANDEGHTRKILSYQVEQYFYSHLAPQLPSSVPVAKCLGSINEHHSNGTSTTAMILSDLKQQYPSAGEKRNVLSFTQVNAALDWLSGFHGFWWSRIKELKNPLLVLPPLEEVQRDGHDASGKTVWLNGGYTYLATRLKEYASLAEDEESEWSIASTSRLGNDTKSVAEMAAAFLAPGVSESTPIDRYQTLIHGDVKSENLFTSRSGEALAFYDFQYTGLGLGVCDLAKLFTCSIPQSMLVPESISHELTMQDGEKKLLECYWRRLKDIGHQEYDWNTFVFHWEVALVDWLRFQASWGFWGNTEWLEARARNILANKEWTATLRKAVNGAVN